MIIKLMLKGWIFIKQLLSIILGGAALISMLSIPLVPCSELSGSEIKSETNILDSTNYIEENEEIFENTYSNTRYSNSGWQQINGSWYYFHGGGQMATGTIYINGQRNRFNSNGQWLGY